MTMAATVGVLSDGRFTLGVGAGAGDDRVAFLQIGDDQDGFLRFLQDELQPILGAAA